MKENTNDVAAGLAPGIRPDTSTDATRRALLLGAMSVAALAPILRATANSDNAPSSASTSNGKGARHMGMLKTKDGTDIFYRDWGKGQPVVFSHGWPLSGDAFEDQMLYLAMRGYRCIAHDRRGHGRSSQPWDGNDLDHYADDLSELFEHLNLRDATEQSA
jgi:non-heme chloroperoxidase